MDAGGAGPGDLVSWFGGIGGTAALVFFLWGFLIKDPPLFVTWREHKRLQEENAKEEGRSDRYLNWILTLNNQAEESTHVAKEALIVAKEKATPTGGRVGSKGQRQADAEQLD